MLKSIIVPVDFSDAAFNALLFAAEIAKRVSARVTILHSLEANEDQEAADQKLKQLDAKLHASFGADLKCESLVMKGGLIQSIEGLAKNIIPDLIVMGTKGATGLKRILVGSNTIKVLGRVKAPVFVIPATARFENFNKMGKNRVVFASDLQEVKNDGSFDVLKDIVSLMIEPRLRVMNVRPKDTSLGFDQELERNALISRFSDEIETERITVFANDVMDGINFYLDKNGDTGMIAMVARENGGLFERHFTREMAAVTQYPLLVLYNTID
ncbi:hypothetical protein GCM10009119_21990 [Algoriphagus jejuensis]|uniref:UspA domain-containing protein n=1 Tax=Algoriphagus jejuensis TaxID=419934 RepID=A0ABN1N133_9BACT